LRIAADSVGCRNGQARRWRKSGPAPHSPSWRTLRSLSSRAAILRPKAPDPGFFGAGAAARVNECFLASVKTCHLCNIGSASRPSDPFADTILVERRRPMGNVGIEEGARRASFSRVGMGQGTLSFSKEYPDPFLNF